MLPHIFPGINKCLLDCRYLNHNYGGGYYGIGRIKEKLRFKIIIFGNIEFFSLLPSA
jgi:hypothetical protein